MEPRFLDFKFIRIICTVAVGAVPVTAVLLTLTEVRVQAPADCAQARELAGSLPGPGERRCLFKPPRKEATGKRVKFEKAR